ncbi:sugar transferase [Radicibacter daui]|uniref:sugar transferase n=1 Tax=Radicibacter daui TaxID=3064829 RepID=UPI004046AF91
MDAIKTGTVAVSDITQLHNKTGRFSFLRPLAPGLLLAASDIVVIQLCLICATLIRAALSPWYPIGIGPAVYLGLHAAVFSLSFAFCFASLYPGYGKTSIERLRLRILAIFAAFGAMLVFDYLAQAGQWSRGILLIAAFLVSIAIPLWDSIARRLMTRAGIWGTPVIVFGPAALRQPIIASLRQHNELGWRPVAEGERALLGAPALPNVGLAIVIADGKNPISGLDHLPYPKVVMVPAVAEMQSLWVQVRDMGTHLGLEMQRNLLVPANRLFKRCFDIVFSVAAILLSLPVVVPVTIAVKLLSPGPLFFTQERHGLDGSTFRIIKFRTMQTDAEERLKAHLAANPQARDEWERFRKLARDPRIIPVFGTLMRRLSIDELPQFINVLRGEMSVVGPRPLPDYHWRPSGDPDADLRMKVRPGITGLVQVSGRSTLPVSEQLRLDSYYVRNWSLWMDLYILARTVSEVLTGKGAW